jgi:hypothetical protein
VGIDYEVSERNYQTADNCMVVPHSSRREMLRSSVAGAVLAIRTWRVSLANPAVPTIFIELPSAGTVDRKTEIALSRAIAALTFRSTSQFGKIHSPVIGRYASGGARTITVEPSLLVGVTGGRSGGAHLCRWVSQRNFMIVPAASRTAVTLVHFAIDSKSERSLEIRYQ